MTKTLIILDNQEFEKYRKYIENKLNLDEKIVGITLDDTIPESELKEKINMKKLSDYDNVGIEFLCDEAYKCVKSMGNIKINETKLVDILRINDLSYWELTEATVRARLVDVESIICVKILESIILMKRVLTKEKPNFVLFSDKTPYGKALKNIFKSEGIKNINLNKEIINLEKLWYKIFYFFAGKAFRLDELHYQIKNKIKSRKAVFGGNKLKIAVFIYIPTNIPVVTPVIKELKNRAEYEVGVFYQETEPLWFGETGKTLKIKGIEAISTKEYFSPSAVRNAKEDIKKIRSQWKSISNESQFKEKIKYDDVPIYDMVENLFSYYFDTKGGRGRIIDVVKHKYYIEELIERENPDLILTLDAGAEFGKALAMFANKKNIPILCLQNGFVRDYSIAIKPCLADKHLLWSEKAKRAFMNVGYDENKLEAVGCPTFDIINDKKKQKSSYMYKKYGINPGKDIFVFATGPYLEEENEKLFRIVFNAMKYFQDGLLIIKLHPREYSTRLHKRIAKQVGIRNILITKNEDLYELLAACKLLITKDSTVGFEALLFDKAVITVNCTEENVWKRATTTVHTTEELVEAIKKVLTFKELEYYDERKDKFIEDYAYKIDGKATERIVNLIGETMKNQKRRIEVPK